MSRLRVAPIVEGHGEEAAVRVLLERLWTELLAGEHIDVLRPIRVSRQKMVQRPEELRRPVELAAAKLRQVRDQVPSLVLLLLDGDGDPPCQLGPRLQQEANAFAKDTDVSCVVAHLEYETWFVAAAPSLTAYLALDGPPPTDPEGARLKKAWVERRFRGPCYSETVDQPALTARMDLALCRSRAPSFDKLCRELERRRTARVPAR